MSSGERWLDLRRRDQYHKLAREKGYRSRAAFKLLETVRRYKFIRRGDVIIDLGAAPGGWTQIARSVVGEEGCVICVDLREIAPFEWGNVFTLRMDIMDASLIARLTKQADGPVDVVISDVSPNVTGIWELDHARQLKLAERSLEIAELTLERGGNFFVKVFHGRELKKFEEKLRMRFRTFRIIKPSASRSQSSEIYFLGLSFMYRPKAEAWTKPYADTPVQLPG